MNKISIQLCLCLVIFLSTSLVGSCRRRMPPSPAAPKAKLSPLEAAQRFESSVATEWVAAFDVKILNEHYINTEEIIIGPPGAWQKLLRIDYLTTDPRPFSMASHCLFYRPPPLQVSLKKRKVLDPQDGAKILGELKSVPLLPGKGCDEMAGFPSDFAIDGVVNLSVILTSSGVPRPSLHPYHLTLLLELYDFPVRQYLSTTLDFPLYNVSQGKIQLTSKDLQMASPVLRQRYSSSARPKIRTGLMVFPVRDRNGEVAVAPSLETPELLGKISDDYADGTLIKCHDVNDECETIQEFTCDRCRFGWFEAVGSECPSGGPKFCGVDRCGGSKEPACPRGGELSRGQGMLNCQNDSQAGFCQEEGPTFCDEGHLLICP